MPTHHAHHLALKRQEKVRNVHRNVCENQKSALSYKPKKIFKYIKVKRVNSLEKSMRMSTLERVLVMWKSNVISSEMIEVDSRNTEFRQEEMQKLKTYLRTCTMMRRKI